jgi:hypothetical protein
VIASPLSSSLLDVDGETEELEVCAAGRDRQPLAPLPPARLPARSDPAHLRRRVRHPAGRTRAEAGSWLNPPERTVSADYPLPEPRAHVVAAHSAQDDLSDENALRNAVFLRALADARR